MPDRTDIEVKLGVLQAWVIGVVCFVLTLCVTGIFTVAYVVVHQRHEANNVLACYIEDSAARSKKALPALTYYKNHPDQLAIANRQIDDSLDAAHDAFGACHRD